MQRRGYQVSDIEYRYTVVAFYEILYPGSLGIELS